MSDTTHNLYSHVKRGSDTRGTEGQWRVVLIIATGAIGPLLSSLTCTQLEMRMKQLDQAATGSCSRVVTVAE